MRHRTITAVLTVFALVLAAAPVAAEDAAPGGTATTDMLGITLEIDGVEVPIGDLVLPGISLDALEIGTLADTTDGTVALVDLLPLALNGSEIGRITLRSEDGQDRSQTGAGIPLGDLGGIGALEARATTTDEVATALVGAAEDLAADLALLGESGVSLSGLLSRSHVDRDEAVSAVGLEVSSIGLGVGDLLGDVLADLPLETLLGLAGVLLESVEGIATDQLESAVGTVDGLIDELEGDVAELAALLDEADDLLDLLDSLGDLTVTELLALADDLDCLIVDITDPIGELTDCVQDDLLAPVVDDLEDVLGDLEGALDDLTDAVAAVVTEVQLLITEALELIGSLVADLEDASLLDVGAIGVGMDARADGDSASASMECVLGGTAVECVEHATAVAGLVGDVLATLGAVADVLGVTTEDIVLEIFGTSTTATSTEGTTNTAEATLEILRLQLPSITIDPSATVDDLVDLVLGLVGDVEDALDDLIDVLDGDAQALLETLGLGDELDDVLDEIDAIVDTDGLLDTLIDAVTDLVDVLLGDLVGPVSTPSLNLVVDPTVTAEFTPGVDDVDLGAPDPDDEPPLPTTGGGLVLLALLALAGAAALLRRRPDGAI